MMIENNLLVRQGGSSIDIDMLLCLRLALFSLFLSFCFASADIPCVRHVNVRK